MIEGFIVRTQFPALGLSMEFEIIVGTYDCAIKGYSLDYDTAQADSKGISKKYEEKAHHGCVRCIASSKHYLATGGTDEVIKLYDLRRHVEVGTLLQHQGSITQLLFVKEKFLLSASEDGTVCVWRCGGGWELVHSVPGHKYGVSGMCLHPSGSLALTVGKDRTLRAWELESGNSVFTQRLKKAAELVCFSGDGGQYALSYGSFIVVHEVQSGDSKSSLEFEKQINCMTFIQNQTLAVGGELSHITLMSTESGAVLTKLESLSRRIKTLCFNNGFLVSGSSNGTINVWKLRESLEESECLWSKDSGGMITSMTIVHHETAVSADKINISQSKMDTVISSAVRKEISPKSKPKKKLKRLT